MPRICDVVTAVPPYRVDQKVAEQFARHHFAGHVRDIERMAQVFSNAGIESRYFSRPIDWLAQPHSLAEKNEVYIQSATELCATATVELLRKHHLDPGDIDYVIYINTTGLATPSIDARLINLLKFKKTVRRTPVWGLGCAGGVAGLSHAYHHALGHPKERILVVAAELCGLTFIADDYSRSNLVATALFGEGAAAALITGDDIIGDGLPLVSSRSRFYPDSLDVMGWNIVSQGLQVVFAQRIPAIVAANAADDFTEFLAEHNLQLADVGAFLFHPGGKKVIEAYQKALGFCDDELAISSDILREFGNMSSVTVLFVLERYLRLFGTARGGFGLISALGPGFCSESILIRT